MANGNQLAGLLSEFAQTIVTDFNVQDVLGHLVESAVDIMPVTGAGVTLISAAVEPRPIAASDNRAMQFEELQASSGEGPCVVAWETGDSVAIPDLGEDDRFPVFAPSALDSGLKAVFTFPLRHVKGQMGALDLYRDVPGPLSEASMADAQTLANVASAYLLAAREHVHPREPSVLTPALRHELTGLPNRTLLSDRLDQACLRSARTGKASAVFFVNLYPSEVVKGTHGWRVADELLVEVATRLTEMSRSGDTVAHLADDQLVVLCDELDRPAKADAFAARVESAMECPFLISGSEVQITAIATMAFVDGQSSAAELLSRHERRGVRPPTEGGECRHRRGTLHEQHVADHRARLERDLHGAAERGELYTHYQPIVAASDGAIVGVEALLRWLHPTLGLVEPAALIPAAEYSGLMVEIGQWVLAQALLAGSSWHSLREHGGFEMAVNVSAYQLRSSGFVDAVEAVLKASQTEPRLLTLEVTESASVSDSTIGILTDLKSLGVRLAFDDFGTGYSSLIDIARFPVDIIKIDRTFVAGMGEDAASTTIVGSVIELAHALGMTVVAEGVETRGQLHELASLGCDCYQGFYFAPPMSVADLDALSESTVVPSYRALLPPPRRESSANRPGSDLSALSI